MEHFSIASLNKFFDKAFDYILLYAPKYLLALLVLFIGLKAISLFVRLLTAGLEKGKIDKTLRPFVTNSFSWGLKILLFISLASMIGIETTSFVAVIGAGSLAIGLALQGTLTNFAGGVLILIFKPFKAGDFITTEGHFGRVDEIHIIVTKLVTVDNRTIVIPNGKLSNNTLINHSQRGQLRLDISIGISYSTNINKAREVLLKVLTDDSRVLSDPAPTVYVKELADSSINLTIRPWTSPDDFFNVNLELLEKCKNALDNEGISIPYPQRVVYLHNIKD